MNSKEDLQKPFSELCVISEDEKFWQSIIQWNISNSEIRRQFTGLRRPIWSKTFLIGSSSCCSFFFYINSYLNSGEICAGITFTKKPPDCAWIKMKVTFKGQNFHKTFDVRGKAVSQKFGTLFEHYTQVTEQVLVAHMLFNPSPTVTTTFKKPFESDLIMDCSMKISLRKIKCALDKEITSYEDSRDYDSGKEMFKYESFSDVSISIKGQLFMTHRTLLARIQYFRELFDANESEQCFELTDIEPEIFNHIHTFLYSGDIPKLNFKLACELYIVASDLKISDLKCLCSSYLGANLTEVNVTMVLKFSEEYEDTSLKRECFKFIKNANVETLTEKSIVL